MSRKSKQIIYSCVGIILYSLVVGFCYNSYGNKYVGYGLFASILIISAMFFTGVFGNKLKLYKIGILCVYFGIIFLSLATAVVKSSIISKIDTAEDIKNLILSYGGWGKFVFVFIQFLQVTFIPIPSTVVTAAGAAIYSPMEALALSMTGLVVGSLFAFFLGKTFGTRLVKWIIGEEALNKYYEYVKGKDKAMIVYMFIFPAFPDDMLCMIAGLTTMSYPTFLIIQLISRPLNIAITVLFIDRIRAIPFNGVGILIWISIALLFIASMVFMWKKADKLEAAALKIVKKITGNRKHNRIRRAVAEQYRATVIADEEERKNQSATTEIPAEMPLTAEAEPDLQLTDFPPSDALIGAALNEPVPELIVTGAVMQEQEKEAIKIKPADDPLRFTIERDIHILTDADKAMKVKKKKFKY